MRFDRINLINRTAAGAILAVGMIKKEGGHVKEMYSVRLWETKDSYKNWRQSEDYYFETKSQLENWVKAIEDANPPYAYECWVSDGDGSNSEPYRFWSSDSK